MLLIERPLNLEKMISHPDTQVKKEGSHGKKERKIADKYKFNIYLPHKLYKDDATVTTKYIPYKTKMR